MLPSSRGFVGRFFGGLWRGIGFVRALVLNLVFLVIVVAVLAALVSGRPAKLESRTALVLDPNGLIVEQFSADPGQIALARLLGQELRETRLRDILTALEAAAADPRIERLVIFPDRMQGAGLATLREIAAAIERFRASGKQVVAFSDGMLQSQYYLAAQADEVWLHPEGAMLLEGFARYRSYFAEALDKLSIDVHLFRVGEFKSAAEPYVLRGQSEEAREADLFWLGSLWEDFLEDIASRRNLRPQDIVAGIEALPERLREADGNFAQLALNQGLVDALKTRDQVRAELIARGEADPENHTFRQVSLNDYVARIERERMAETSRRLAKGTPQVAVVVAQGPITFGEQPGGTIGGETTSRLLRDARNDDKVRAIVLRVDSPGGGVFPSEQIRREVELTVAAGKPIVVSMGDVAASGGYWISMDADEIVADAATITGSIGIFGLFLTVPDALARLGIYSDGVGTTSFAGALDPTRPLDPRVGEAIQTLIERGYRDFIERVAKARELSFEAADAVGRGRVWSGRQAYALGLVDRLGNLQDAIAAAAERAGLDADFVVRYIEREPTPFERLLARIGGGALAGWIGQRIGPDSALLRLFPAPLAADLHHALRLIEPAQGPLPVATYAYCFCTVK